MRHRLFHAVVLAALPGCGSSSPPVTPDVTHDTGVAVQQDSASAPDTTAAEVAADALPDTASTPETEPEPDANCYCKPGCLPCIK